MSSKITVTVVVRQRLRCERVGANDMIRSQALSHFGRVFCRPAWLSRSCFTVLVHQFVISTSPRMKEDH